MEFQHKCILEHLLSKHISYSNATTTTHHGKADLPEHKDYSNFCQCYQRLTEQFAKTGSSLPKGVTENSFVTVTNFQSHKDRGDSDSPARGVRWVSGSESVLQHPAEVWCPGLLQAFKRICVKKRIWFEDSTGKHLHYLRQPCQLHTPCRTSR